MLPITKKTPTLALTTGFYSGLFGIKSGLGKKSWKPRCLEKK